MNVASSRLTAALFAPGTRVLAERLGSYRDSEPITELPCVYTGAGAVLWSGSRAARVSRRLTEPTVPAPRAAGSHCRVFAEVSR